MKKPTFLTLAPALALTVILCAPGISFAQSQRGDPAAQSAAGDQTPQAPAEKFIQDLGNKALAIIADKSLTPEQRDAKYKDILTTAFDMPTIGKFVLGRAWNTASPQQQQEYLKLFEQQVVKIYGSRLNFYSGEGFKIVGMRQEDGRDVIVNTQVTHPDGSKPTPIDWRVRQDNGKLAVLDVSVEGISQSVTQRQEYASILQSNNGNIDGLLAKMRQNSQQGAETTTQ